MAKINIPEFARYVENYIAYSFDRENFLMRLVEESLSTPYQKEGVCFCHNTELALRLLKTGYDSLRDVRSRDYSIAVAKAMQEFAEPFPSGDYNLCYPHFLLHGLELGTLEGVVGKIRNNSRIIHETLAIRAKVAHEYDVKEFVPVKGVEMPVDPNNGAHFVEGFHTALSTAFCYGLCEDFFGITLALGKQCSGHPRGSNYIVKVSFFLDTTKKEIYIITIQGKQFSEGMNNEVVRVKNEKFWGMLTTRLGTSPRTFLLKKVMEWGKQNGYERIKVIRAKDHPLTIEQHKGFLANYEPVVIKAGINQENGCYLEAKLENMVNENE
ncbi:hypothetical protein HZA97_10140 [Candidatus Woesearchaeota archaeon]|nr:hypothetical protein [Candidatus Woesearchaeota archaeon]